MKTAIFVGSFDPFHAGHKSIVDRAARLFDKVVVGVGVNPDKHYMLSTEERVARTKDALKDTGVFVEAYEGLTIDFARRHNAQYIVKGVRNAEDFINEKWQAEWNKQHGAVETVLLLAEPELEQLSSSKIRTSVTDNKAQDTL